MHIQMFNRELCKTVGLFALKRYYLYIDIDKIALKAKKILSKHPGKNDKHEFEDCIYIKKNKKKNNNMHIFRRRLFS